MTLQYVSVDLSKKGTKFHVYTVEHPDPVRPGAMVEITMTNGQPRLVRVETVEDRRPESLPASAQLKSAKVV